LAAPIKTPPAGVEPIAIYADYSIHRKGTVWIEDDEGEFSAAWECYLSPSGAARFDILRDDGANARFELEIKQETAKIELAYPKGGQSRKAKLCDDSGELERRRSRDLVQLLNSEEAFTVVLTRGISYRFGGYWKNDGLDQPFTKLQTDIDWKGIDIKKESLDNSRKDTIGDAILRYLKTKKWAEVVICDDGSNEVADYLVVGDGRIALVHAKYSADSKAGLRVGDLQEVLAQCLKNLQFFQWVALEPHLDRLVDRTRPEFTTRKKTTDFLRETYENQRAKRECWIVQPGISADKLSKRRQNKIHSLLNYAESACLPGNVEFRFFCSP
jgi:hypothetical protein